MCFSLCPVDSDKLLVSICYVTLGHITSSGVGYFELQINLSNYIESRPQATPVTYYTSTSTSFDMSAFQSYHLNFKTFLRKKLFPIFPTGKSLDDNFSKPTHEI